MNKMTKREVLEFARFCNKPVKFAYYCELENKLGISRNQQDQVKLGYNSGVYGWNYDVLNFNKCVVVSGYRPFSCDHVTSEDLED